MRWLVEWYLEICRSARMVMISRKELGIFVKKAMAKT
jgi:hypothetical protein